MTTVVSVFVAAAALILAIGSWSRRVCNSYLAAAHGVREFVALTKELLEDERVPQVAKNTLLAISPYIGDKELAKLICRRTVEPRPSRAPDRLWDTVDKLEDAHMRNQIYWAVLLFMTALSYRDRTQGWRLRARLMGHEGEQSVRPAASEAIQVVHDRGGPVLQAA